MNEKRKKELVESFEYTFRGRKARVGGWRNPYATITTSQPGFYQATWEEIEGAAETNDGVIENAWLVNGCWLGCR